ncbi:helix-turn-helix domain-containing protein [Pseudomonas benzopyrenica]|uniref:helix-turn-helix domain-containing protein n=1 Tax=Pseudomonas benzopyrenica TaxID=2993566 RepID=UPI003F1599BC
MTTLPSSFLDLLRSRQVVYLHRARHREGVARAKAAGLYRGRQMEPARRAAIRQALTAGESITSIAKRMSVCRNTVYIVLRQMEGRGHA